MADLERDSFEEWNVSGCARRARLCSRADRARRRRHRVARRVAWRGRGAGAGCPNAAAGAHPAVDVHEHRDVARHHIAAASVLVPDVYASLGRIGRLRAPLLVMHVASMIVPWVAAGRCMTRRVCRSSCTCLKVSHNDPGLARRLRIRRRRDRAVGWPPLNRFAWLNYETVPSLVRHTEPEREQSVIRAAYPGSANTTFTAVSRGRTPYHASITDPSASIKNADRRTPFASDRPISQSHPQIGITQQREPQPIPVPGTASARPGESGARADDRPDPGSARSARESAYRLRLRNAVRRPGLGIEVQEQPLAAEVGERDGPPLLVEE